MRGPSHAADVGCETAPKSQARGPIHAARAARGKHFGEWEPDRVADLIGKAVKTGQKPNLPTILGVSGKRSCQ